MYACMYVCPIRLIATGFFKKEKQMRIYKKKRKIVTMASVVNILFGFHFQAKFEFG